eukprot:g663.t1
MLGADREVLAATRVAETANLLEKEMGYTMTELGAMATQAALLGGFVMGALSTQGSTNSGNPEFGKGGEAYQNNPGASMGFWNSAPQGLRCDPNDPNDPNYSNCDPITRYTTDIAQTPHMSANLAISETIFTLVMALSFVSNLLCICHSTFILVWAPRRALMAQEGDMEKVLIRTRIERRTSVQHFILGVSSFVFATPVYAWCYWQGPSAIVMTLLSLYALFELYRMEKSLRQFFKQPPVFTSELFFGNSYDPNEEPKITSLMDGAELLRDLHHGPSNATPTSDSADGEGIEMGVVKPDFEGWMTKRGQGRLARWKRMYFEKKGAKLSFYKIPTGQFPTSSTRSLAGELWLQAGTFQETDVKGHHHCFQFMDMKNIKHVVACDTAMQREQWLKTLVALSADEPTGVSGLPAGSKFEAGAGVMSSNPAYE